MKKLTKQLQPARTGIQQPGNEREAAAEIDPSGSPKPSGGASFYGSPDGRNDTGNRPADAGHSKPTLGDY